MTPRFWILVRSFTAAVLGAVAFVALNLPLPLLLGPLFGCLIAALGGMQMGNIKAIDPFTRAILGVAIGASITPELISKLPSYAPSLILIPLLVLGIGVIGYPLFRWGYGYNSATSYYSAMPGGLTEMLAFGEEAGGNIRTLSLIHATRVVFIVSVAPFALTLMFGLDLTAPPGAPATSVPFLQFLWMGVAGIVGIFGGRKIGLFGADLIGPMIVAGALSLSGMITMRPPAEAMWVAQFFIGLSVGAKYTGITATELRRDITAGAIFSVALGILSMGFIWLVMQFSTAPVLDIVLSFLPGGQAEMAIIAIVAGADVAFVVSHHIARLLVVILCAPAVARFLK